MNKLGRDIEIGEVVICNDGTRWKCFGGFGMGNANSGSALYAKNEFGVSGDIRNEINRALTDDSNAVYGGSIPFETKPLPRSAEESKFWAEIGKIREFARAKIEESDHGYEDDWFEYDGEIEINLSTNNDRDEQECYAYPIIINDKGETVTDTSQCIQISL